MSSTVTKSASIAKKRKIISYPVFWVIWAFLLFVGVIAAAQQADDFGQQGFRTIVALLLIGVFVWLRQIGKLVAKPSNRAFWGGILLILSGIPFWWIFVLILWFYPKDGKLWG